jgi:hypothetical protein
MYYNITGFQCLSALCTMIGQEHKSYDFLHMITTNKPIDTINVQHASKMATALFRMR